MSNENLIKGIRNGLETHNYESCCSCKKKILEDHPYIEEYDWDIIANSKVLSDQYVFFWRNKNNGKIGVSNWEMVGEIFAPPSNSSTYDSIADFWLVESLKRTQDK